MTDRASLARIQGARTATNNSRRAGRRHAVAGAVHRRRGAGTPGAPRSVRAARRRESRRLPDGRRGREPLRLRGVECRLRQAGDAAGARAAGRGRQVRAVRLAAARAGRRPLSARAASRAVRARARRSRPPRRAAPGLYRTASVYAARFCRRVAARLARARTRGATRELLDGAAAFLSLGKCAQAARTSSASREREAAGYSASGSGSPEALRASSSRFSLIHSPSLRRSRLPPAASSARERVRAPTRAYGSKPRSRVRSTVSLACSPRAGVCSMLSGARSSGYPGVARVDPLDARVTTFVVHDLRSTAPVGGCGGLSFELLSVTARSMTDGRLRLFDIANIPGSPNCSL